MQAPEVSSTQSAPSFSALLTSLTSHLAMPDAQEPEDSLQDDVVSLSYEQALRHAARRRTPGASTPTAVPPRSTDVHAHPALPLKAHASQSERARCGAPRKVRMSSSVTIRLDKAESTELRARAAEAGLTVSGYLRSCIFEVEDLRTQVKQALVEMRSTPPQQAVALSVPLQAPPTGWRERIFPRWVLHRSALHA